MSQHPPAPRPVHARMYCLTGLYGRTVTGDPLCAVCLREEEHPRAVFYMHATVSQSGIRNCTKCEYPAPQTQPASACEICTVTMAVEEPNPAGAHTIIPPLGVRIAASLDDAITLVGLRVNHYLRVSMEEADPTIVLRRGFIAEE